MIIRWYENEPIRKQNDIRKFQVDKNSGFCRHQIAASCFDPKWPPNSSDLWLPRDDLYMTADDLKRP